jgi:hypothetical protein
LGKITVAALFAATILLALTGRVLICRRLLHFVAALAGLVLARTLVLLRRCLLGRAALTAGRGLALVLLRRCLLGRAALTAGRGLVGTLIRLGTLARRSATLRAGHVRQSERRDSLTIQSSAGLKALLPLERDQRLRCPRAQSSVHLNVEPSLLQHDLGLADLLRSQIQCA